MVKLRDLAPASVKGAVFGLLLSLLLSVGCGSVTTQKGFYEPITADLENSNFEAAARRIEAAKAENKYKKKDRFLYYVDAGLAYHYASLFDTSNQRLTQAEDAADELFTKSVSRAATSLLLNDNVLEYAGEDYEILYTNLIMALNYMAQDDFDGAFVEVKRANEKLNLLELKYADASRRFQEGSQDDEEKVEIEYSAKKVRFNNDAFARYLSMHVYAADGKMDDARIDHELLRSAFREQPHIYDFDVPDITYYSEDKSILSVVALAGLSPVKEALNLRIRTDKDLDLVQVLYTDPWRKDSEYGHLPMPVSEDYYFKFSIPEIVPRSSRISRVRVFSSSEFLGELQLLEDVARVAEETFQAKKSLIYLRTVARAVAKGLAAHKAKEKVDSGGVKGWLKKAAVDVATDVSENADLRCSRLLPGRIYVGDFEVEPGTYDLEIEFLDENGDLVSAQELKGYQVLKKGLNLVEAVSLK
ncbi:MAG: hypothetical protein JSV10_02680 [Candidatus Zixiibacteriota bacterium]|nr:MAG: hypothetical protein JSV10_02680 [candidate division Zixibacteria bacterium]